ncbi:MAG: biotin transporter BioY [Clostridia bacterium]|nr:biotin transporter BioY [Clostridia bacterium]
MKTKDTVICGVITAILCVISPIAIPVGGIPLTLSTLVIYIVAAVTRPYISVVSVILYIFIGMLGLTVFSGFSGGVTHILGPGGGFILGYIPLTVCIALFKRSKKGFVWGIIAGTVILYICGCTGYLINTDCSFKTMLSICILPFLPFDIIKIILSITISPKIIKNKM